AAAVAFAALGATVVDTDAIAHALTRPGGTAIDGVRALFGEDALRADGAMDRAWVRSRVFSNPAERLQLEALLHPMIGAESRRQIDAAAGPYVVHVVPLLVEAPDHRDRYARIAVVDCPEAMQVSRVQRRSGLEESEIRRIVSSQVPRARRLAAADDVIDNGGSLESLQAQVRALHKRYVELARDEAA
ncbi:MAG: dephospho-CoA kinase, partial [Proteobacteria bacterium]|nr:dephospho-CoA kinase [Pseudomonadota bacterium]